ncbi:class I SAM-dependent DNA methyltransferase [Nonlabens xiamenensis]|uniref:class I SAM-dependent DNA methyltransferase n=1 Tax=Nonlabens xiamenensis TaxID=2341043 RepID=UPI000F615DAD|nr:methyltransferase domain-containing protein [Nonlabens xiamenensis]
MKQSPDQVISYYDSIATNYDESRFSNTYGAYVHQQEIGLLDKYVGKENAAHHVDLGCGTGRFLAYADTGVDPSQEMLKIAKAKHPDKILLCAKGNHTTLAQESYDKIYSLHVMMHLHQEEMLPILIEAHRLLKNKGLFLFDFPSKKRRNLIRYRPVNWHGATSYNLSEIKKISQEYFDVVESCGIIFFPIHRIPKQLRKYLLFLDGWLCRSWLKSYSSYIFVVLRKK